jgi:hypothetical protein
MQTLLTLFIILSLLALSIHASSQLMKKHKLQACVSVMNARIKLDKVSL